MCTQPQRRSHCGPAVASFAAMPQTIPVDDFTLTAELPETETGLPPVLLVHGICVSTWCFEHFLKGFAAHGLPTYAVPLSGRDGGRPGDLGKLTIADFCG